MPVSNPEDDKQDGDTASQVSGATKEELKELTQRNREAKPEVGEKLSQIAEDQREEEHEGSMPNVPNLDNNTPNTQHNETVGIIKQED